MIRKFKVLGLAVFAVMAMSALGASAAQATPTFTQSVPNSPIHATAENIEEVFHTEAGTLGCKVSHYSDGTIKNTGTHPDTLKIHPDYTSCMLGPISFHITTTGCIYTFTATEKVSVDVYKAHVGIECESGKVITISATGTECVATVGPTGNTNLTTVTLTNDTASGDVTVKPEVEGLNYTVTKDGFLCPFNGTGAKTGGKYTSTGSITATAASGTASVSGE